MMNNITHNQDRRRFIFSIVPACTVSCLLFSSSMVKSKEKKNFQDEIVKNKYQNDFCRTYEEAWKWRYNYYINLMEELAKIIGREKLIELLKNSTDNITFRNTKRDSNFKLSEFGNILKTSELYRNTLTFEIIENTDSLLETKITKCLWAKTFREKNAGDIGYAIICHSDFSEAKAMHPKLHLERTKTLMQGFDCCHFRYAFES